MVLESTMVCFDNSNYQRNGDYFPTRLSVQKDGVHLVCLTKVRSNPENNVGLMTMSKNGDVLATLTSDVGRIFSKLHEVQPNGEIHLIVSIRIAHLVLKHRQGRNHKMRIVVFVGSPITHTADELVKLAKRLKKEKVNVDVVSFGEHENNNEILAAFINTLNGNEGTGSHLVSVPRGSDLSDALLSSPIIQGEDGLGGAGLTGASFEFGVDPNEDPELALALRISMDEQRHRQEEEQRRALADSNNENAANGAAAAEAAETKTGGDGKKAASAKETGDLSREEGMLQRALALSTVNTDDIMPDFGNMTEEEQIAFAMQMSMQEGADETATTLEKSAAKNVELPSSMDVDEDCSDANFLQNVIENLPGVDAKPNDKEKDTQKK